MFSLEAKIEKVYCKMIKETESEERERRIRRRLQGCREDLLGRCL